jgi:steroid delta-isomerase-like uncharacterized protein
MSAEEENKAVVRRHLEQAVSQGRHEVWDEIMAEDFVLHHPMVPPGRAAYARSVEILREGFPDLREEVLDLVAEGDRVVARYIERGTHTGTFFGLPPSGRAYEKHGLALYRLAGGRLAEVWIQEDERGFERQIFG